MAFLGQGGKITGLVQSTIEYVLQSSGYTFNREAVRLSTSMVTLIFQSGFPIKSVHSKCQ